MHNAVTQLRFENCTYSMDITKCGSGAMKDCSSSKELAPRGSKFFPLRDVAILKRNVIGVIDCSFQYSFFDARRYIIVLASHWAS